MLPYQHLYWAFLLPFLRFSWLIQSIQFVASMPFHFHKCYRQRFWLEALCLSIHWSAVLFQLYTLPTYYDQVVYFLVSHLFAGFLLAYVVTYNHYSVDKFPRKSSFPTPIGQSISQPTD